MAAKKKTQPPAAGRRAERELPPGVKLLRTLEGCQVRVTSVAFDPKGETLASGSEDNTVKLWEARSGKLLQTLEGHEGTVVSLAFDPQGGTLAGGSVDDTVKLWEARSGKLLRTFQGHQSAVWGVVFDTQGGTLASGSLDQTVMLWEVRSGKLLRTLEGHQGGVTSLAFDPQGESLASGSDGKTAKLWEVRSGKLLRTLGGHDKGVASVAFHPQGGTLASGSDDRTVKLWEARSGRLLRTLEGHTGDLDIVAFCPDGSLLASKSRDDTIRLWSCKTWETVAVIPEPTFAIWTPALAFHPTLPLLAAAGSEPDTPKDKRSRLIHLWALDYDVLLGKRRVARPAVPVEASVQHRTAKVILVGDTGVGKSALAHRLVLGKFVDTRSSHARRAWVLDSSTVKTPADVDEHRETVLWDLAGQPAYRLVHQLAMDDAAVACVLFDARSETGPLEGAAYWSQALDQVRTNTPITKLLVPARTDVGGLPVSEERLRAFAREHGFAPPVFPTSAYTGEGCPELLEAVREHIRWDDLPAVSSTETLAALRKFVAALKDKAGLPPLLAIADLHQRFEDDYGKPVPMDKFLAFLQRLEDTDAVDLLAFDSIGQAPTPETQVLLDPTRVDAYASALLVAARDEPDGPGHLLESRVRKGKFRLPKSERLRSKKAEEHLLWFVLEGLFARDLALRETIKGEDYVVFPAQCTSELKFPGKAAFGVAFGFAGPVRSIYAALIAQLAHYEGFSKRWFYQDAAAYRADHGGRCLVRLRDHGNGTAELELSFEPDTPESVRRGFLEFVARHLKSRSKPDSVTSRHAHHCANTKCRQPFQDELVKARLQQRRKNLLCPFCEKRTPLVNLLAPPTAAVDVVADRMDADAKAGRRRIITEWVVKAKETEGQFDVFLSYSAKDRPEVTKIAEELKEVGLRPWVDYEWLVPGQSWIPALEKVIKDIPCAAVFVGADGLGPWVVAETQGMLIQMVRRQAGVMPVLLPGAPDEPNLPPFLETVTWVDMRDWQSEESEGLERLVSGILGKPIGELRMLGR